MVNPGWGKGGWTQMEIRTDGLTDGQTSGNSPCVVQEIGPIGPLSKKFEKDNSVNDIEVLLWGWMDGDGWTLMGQFVVGEGQFEAEKD